MTTKGTIQVTANGSVQLYINGNLDIGGNGTVNLTNKPESLLIVGTNKVNQGQTIKLHGNGAIKAAVYAPYANLEMKGGGNSGTFIGAAVASNVTMTGNSNFHYDEALGNFALDNSYKISRWRELIDYDGKVPLSTPDQVISYAVSYNTEDDFKQPPKPEPEPEPGNGNGNGNGCGKKK